MDQKFAKKVAELRKEKGLTQAELAEKLSLSPQAISKWENGESLPDITTLPLLADILGVTIDELLGRAKPVKPVEVVEPPHGDYSAYFLRVVALSQDGDKARINLPLSVVEIMFRNTSEITIGSITLKDSDFKQIIAAVEVGAVGEILTAESKDGDMAKIFIEKVVK